MADSGLQNTGFKRPINDAAGRPPRTTGGQAFVDARANGAIGDSADSTKSTACKGPSAGIERGTLTPAARKQLAGCRKWDFLGPTFVLHVPAAGRAELTAMLKGEEAMAAYFRPGGTLFARQWCLNKSEWSAIWRSRLLEDSRD